MPLDQISVGSLKFLQEPLLCAQEPHNVQLTNDQLDSFDACTESEHGLAVPSPVSTIGMLSTPLMKIEEDTEN